MQLLVFVTEDGGETGAGPTLFIEDKPDAVMPKNPRSLPWRYFATISDQDEMFVASGISGRHAVEVQGHFISNRMI